MIHFATFKNKSDAQNGVLHHLEIQECINKYLSWHQVVAYKDGPSFTLAHYENIKSENGKEIVHRHSDNITGAYGLCFDIDNEEGREVWEIGEAEALFADYTYVIHTTFSHLETTGIPRFRIILFFNRMVAREDYARIWDYFRAMIPSTVNVDKAGRIISQAWFLPMVCKRRQAYKHVKYQMKELIDVDEVLRKGDLANDQLLLDDISTDQCFTTTPGATQARSSLIYNMNFPEVNKKIANSSSKNSLTNLTNPLTLSDNDNNDLYDRVMRVLSESEMHVSNFTGANYLEWIKIGSAIKGSGLPFDLFNEWCSKDPDKYPGVNDLRRKWDTFNGSANAGTIFKMAEERGVPHYLGLVSNKKSSLPATIKKTEYEEAPLTYEESLEVKPRVKDTKLKAFPIELCNKAPEPIARYMEYVMETNTHPHPVFALANSISTLGALYHQRIQAKYKRCCTNMYILTLALAGQGKAHAFNCTRAVYKALGLTMNLAPIPASTAGLITGLRGREGNMFMLVDEFEKKFLRMLNSKAAGAHYIQVSGELMNLYTIPHEPYVGEMMYADASKNNIAPIINPHLSIYGACVDNDFYKHYAGEGAEDGFLARIMPFINKEYYPSVNENYKDIDDIPKELLKMLRNIVSKPIHVLGSDLDMSLKPEIIDFDCEKTKRFHTATVEYWRGRTWKEGQDGNHKVASLYSRQCENALKIALTAQEGGVITRSTWEWALDVATTIAEISINNAIVTVAENNYHSKVMRMENILIKKGGWLTKEYITHQFKEDAKTREDVLQWLIDAGKVAHRIVKEKGMFRPRHEYMAI